MPPIISTLISSGIYYLVSSGYGTALSSLLFRIPNTSFCMHWTCLHSHTRLLNSLRYPALRTMCGFVSLLVFRTFNLSVASSFIIVLFSYPQSVLILLSYGYILYIISCNFTMLCLRILLFSIRLLFPWVFPLSFRLSL